MKGKMKILILGGTVFLGRHLIDAALARGHEVTIFNRGQRNAEIPAQVEWLKGDRAGDLEALRGRRWETVIDTSGYVPHIVRESAGLLADAVEHYTFVSTCSVYRDTKVPGVDENYPTGKITGETLREVENIKPVGSDIVARQYGEWYGPLKALCEEAAEEMMPGRVFNVRAGLIVGPFDYSDRFTYWPRRVAQGGEVLAPGNPDRQVQFIDARDLAEWIVRMSEARRAGTYNATGPDYVLTMRRMLEECRSAIGSDAEFVWADDKFLLDAGLTPWTEVPLWIPQEEEDDTNLYFMGISNAKAVRDGLTFRPLMETVRATLDWDATRPPDTDHLAGIAREREREVLEALSSRA